MVRLPGYYIAPPIALYRAGVRVRVCAVCVCVYVYVCGYIGALRVTRVCVRTHARCTDGARARLLRTLLRAAA